MAYKNNKRLSKEFDSFARKIAELESLREQLHTLPSKGFENDIRLIEAKMKNIEALPEIRRDIKRLHFKIDQKQASKYLHSKIDKVLLRESDVLKKEVSTTKKKIAELEELIAKKRKVSVKKQLSKKDLYFVKDIPSLENELKKLHAQFLEHTHASKIKIDTGVGVIVDTRFDDFLSQIKAEITERLKEKESLANLQLKSDLEKREMFFAQRYKEMIEELHDKYKSMVKEELGKEVRRKLNEEVEKKLGKEEKSMIKRLIFDNMIELKNERKKIIFELAVSYREKEQRLKNMLENKSNRNIKSNIESEKKRLGSEFNSKVENIKRDFHQKLRNKVKIIGEMWQERLRKKEETFVKIEEEKKELENKEYRERKNKNKLDEMWQERLKKKEEVVAKTEEEWQERLKKKEEVVAKTEEEWQERLKKKEETFVKIEGEEKKRFKEKLSGKLKEKEKELRREYEASYHEKLSGLMKKKEAEFKKKKAELEKHVLAEAKKVFG